VVRSGFRCSACGPLQLSGGPCVECGGQNVAVPDVYEEAVREAIEQDAQVRDWQSPALRNVDSIAAFQRF
jgi:hypothetical protein